MTLTTFWKRDLNVVLGYKGYNNNIFMVQGYVKNGSEYQNCDVLLTLI